MKDGINKHNVKCLTKEIDYDLRRYGVDFNGFHCKTASGPGGKKHWCKASPGFHDVEVYGLFTFTFCIIYLYTLTMIEPILVWLARKYSIVWTKATM